MCTEVACVCSRANIYYKLCATAIESYAFPFYRMCKSLTVCRDLIMDQG